MLACKTLDRILQGLWLFQVVANHAFCREFLCGKITCFGRNNFVVTLGCEKVLELFPGLTHTNCLDQNLIFESGLKAKHGRKRESMF